MGFVGLTLAAFLAKKTDVLGVETSNEVMDVLTQGRAHFYEVGLDDAINKSVLSGSLRFSQSPEAMVARVVYVLTIGTPLIGDQIGLEALTRTSQQIALVAKNEDLVIVRSTVSLGSSRKIVAQSLTDLGKTTSVAMCPERTIEGRALEELIELPQIVGGLTEEASELACEFFAGHGVETTTVSSPEAAEMAKLATNTFRDLQFAFANELAVLSDAAGLNAREIIAAANHRYPRSNISSPGLTAGPCLEKDPWILYNSGRDKGVVMSVTRSSRTTHENVPRLAIEQLLTRFPTIQKNGRILLAGMAFKGDPETDDTRGSLAFTIIDELKSRLPNMEIWTLDPLVDPSKLPSELSKNHLTSLSGNKVKFELLVVQHNGAQLVSELVHFKERFEKSYTLDFWGDLVRHRDKELFGVGSYVFGGEKK